MRHLLTAGFVIAAVQAAAPAFAQGHSYEQERYCTGDAFRLCGAYIPDVDRITACMIQRKAELTAACRAVFGPPRPSAPPAPVARAPDPRDRPYDRPYVGPPPPPPPPTMGRPRPPVFDDYDD